MESKIIQPFYLLGFQMTPWIGFSVCRPAARMSALKGSALHIFRRDGSCPVRNAGCPRRDRAAYTVGSRGDGTLPFLALRSVGHTSVSASSSSRLGLLDLGNGAGSGAASDDCPLGAGSAAGSAVPSMASAASPAAAPG